MAVRRQLGSTAPTHSGMRDVPVTVQRRRSVGHTEPSGFPVSEWVPMADVFMAREDLAGKEEDRPGQRFTYGSTRWEMPYRPDMDPDIVNVPAERRLVYHGVVFDIEAATAVGRQRTIALFTRVDQ